MATTPYFYEFDTAQAFPSNPNEQSMVGYVTAFSLDLIEPTIFNADQKVTDPMSWPAKATINVVGVISTFGWDGDLADPLEIVMYVSPDNATLLRASKLPTLGNIRVSALDYVIAGYDQETKQWFTRAAPDGQSLSGTVAANDTSELTNPAPGSSADASDPDAYKVIVKIAPSDQVYFLTFAGTPTERVVKEWGVVTGSPGTAAAGIEGAS